MFLKRMMKALQRIMVQSFSTYIMSDYIQSVYNPTRSIASLGPNDTIKACVSL